MPAIDAEASPDLEELCGADFMITPLQMPARTSALIQKHLDAGALLVQRKSGGDLVSSVGPRLNNSLARMQTFNVRNCQCVLLFCGTLDLDEDGFAIVNGIKEPYKYWSVQSAMDKWTDRGGVVKQLVSDNLIPYWVERKEHHLREFRHFPVKRVWKIRNLPGEVEESDPIQELVPISNKLGKPGYWRPMLVQIPGLGPTRVNAIYQYMRKAYGKKNMAGGMDTPLQALALLTGPVGLKIDGIGKGIHMNVRRWLGLEDVYELAVIAREKDVSNGG